jgi:hypothetical protein
MSAAALSAPTPRPPDRVIEANCRQFFPHGVAAADVPPPPMHVVSRDLRRLSTMRGIRLGQPVADVFKVYGKAHVPAVPGHPDVRLLAYTTWPTRRAMRVSRTQCGQEQQFFFRGDRLVLIRLGNGC